MPWPYMESQCPSCRYFEPFEPELRDPDDGYVLPGACAHPHIAMMLFRTRRREIAQMSCRLRWPRAESESDGAAKRAQTPATRDRG